MSDTHEIASDTKPPSLVLHARLSADAASKLDAACAAHVPPLTRTAMVNEWIYREHAAIDARQATELLDVTRQARLAQLATKRRGLLPGMEEDTKERVYTRLDLSGKVLERSSTVLKPGDFEHIETFAVMRKHDGATYEKSISVGDMPLWIVHWQERASPHEIPHDDPCPTEEEAHNWKREVIDEMGCARVVNSYIVGPNGQRVPSRSSPGDVERRWVVRWKEAPGKYVDQKSDGSVARYFATETEAQAQLERVPKGVVATMGRNTESTVEPVKAELPWTPRVEPPRVPGSWQLCWRQTSAPEYTLERFPTESAAMARSYQLAAEIVDVLILEPA